MMQIMGTCLVKLSSLSSAFWTPSPQPCGLSVTEPSFNWTVPSCIPHTNQTICSQVTMVVSGEMMEWASQAILKAEDADFGSRRASLSHSKGGVVWISFLGLQRHFVLMW